MDTGELEWRLLDTAVLRIGDLRVYVVHEASGIARGGVPEGVGIVVSGHTHRPLIERVGDVLFVNPGSAGGKNRDGRGPTLAVIEIAGSESSARIVDLA